MTSNQILNTLFSENWIRTQMANFKSLLSEEYDYMKRIMKKYSLQTNDFISISFFAMNEWMYRYNFFGNGF